MLSWLLIVWSLVACGAAGYRVPDMHHHRWTPRKAALVPKQSRFECQKSFARPEIIVFPAPALIVNSVQRKQTPQKSVSYNG